MPSMAATALPPFKADLEGVGPIAGLDYDDDHVLRAPSLRFAVAGNPFSGGVNNTEDARRLIAAVGAALARRTADVEALEINFVYSSSGNIYVRLPPEGFYVFRHGHAADITSAHLAAWLRFAELRVTGSFTLAVPTLSGPGTKAAAPCEQKRVAELPSSARAETMSLSLGDAGLTVPAAGAGAFRALGDLLLSHARIEPGGADERNLSHLLSASCCPQLRRLRLEHIAGLAALRLDAAATLEELRLDHLRDLSSLELDAPGLRALHVAGCYKMVDDEASATISAPRLETLAFDSMCHPDRLLQFDGAATVRRLEKIFLWSHVLPGRCCNEGALWLLQHCTAADSLSMEICPPMEEDEIEEMARTSVPQLPSITSLTIDVTPGRWHNLKAFIAELITKCSRVEHLSIDIQCANNACLKAQCPCKGEDDDQKISMEHLREAKITGFRPSKYHQSLVGLMIAGAPALERMALQLDIGMELNGSLPCDRGHWIPCVTEHSSKRSRTTVYEWTPDKKKIEEGERSDYLILSRF
ncbi:hypothetical protein ACP70R_018415 [Stipagrostis hirtigluma subsp. patula]